MRWIKANEMGPDLKHKDQFSKMFSDNVICLDEDGEPHIACLTYWDFDFMWEFTDDEAAHEVDEVTYWAPIPPLSKEDD